MCCYDAPIPIVHGIITIPRARLFDRIAVVRAAVAGCSALGAGTTGLVALTRRAKAVERGSYR